MNSLKTQILGSSTQPKTIVFSKTDEEHTRLFSNEPTPHELRRLPDGTLLGDYKTVRVIGQGGFGIVYEAIDSLLERRVAIKEYFPSDFSFRANDGQVSAQGERSSELFDAGKRSFLNEAKLLAQFDHPALVRVFRYWEANGTAYMAMPLLEGMTLKALKLHRETHGQPVQTEEVIEYIIQLASSLDLLHQAGCIHRDISPDNIIIDSVTDEPVLLDFGAARRTIEQRNKMFTTILRAGYAPIEQYAEIPDLQQGPWTDVYALCATIYWLITGVAPAPAVGRSVCDNYEPLLPRATTEKEKRLFGAIDQGLAVLPEARIQSMEDLSVAVQPDIPGEAFTPTQDAVFRIKPPENDIKQISLKRVVQWLTALGTAGLVALTIAWWPKADLPHQPAVPQSPIEAITIHSPQAPLKIGHDHLQFKIKSANSGYLSIYTHTSGGDLIRLIPNADNNIVLLRAGQTFEFPPDDEPLIAYGPAGDNQFLVSISDYPLNHQHFAGDPELSYVVLRDNQLTLDDVQQSLERIGNKKAQINWAHFAVTEID